MSFLDTIMSDTVGVAYRAATGSVDPWTKQELIDQAAADNIKAGADPATAQAQAEADVTSTLSTFTLGGDDPVGADPSQAKLSIPSGQSMSDTFNSLTNDNGTGCGITNLAGCLPTVPTWAKFAVGGVAVLGVLWLLRPYIGLANSVRG
jgi:hypothetical protein